MAKHDLLITPGSSLEKWLFKRFIGDVVVKEFDELTINFQKSQRETLERIIKKNEATRWGRDHKFSRLGFSNWSSHPIVTYEQVEPYIQRIKLGDLNALTSEPPIAFALTSGTTSNPKYIILNEQTIDSQKKAGKVWDFHLLMDHGKHLAKILLLNGSQKQRHNEHFPVSSYTEIVRQKQPFYVKRRFIFPKEAESVSDFEHRLLIATQQAFISQPEALISVNPSTILRLLDLTEEYRREIFNATENGNYIGTNIRIKKPGNKREVLENILSGNPLKDVNIIGTWLGGTQHLFVDKLREKGVSANMRDLGYISTEGKFTIPIADNSPAGILNLFGNFYEFLSPNGSLVDCDQLNVGEEYNLIVTTENGLYRYNIQDVVRVEGWHSSAPLISFRRKDSCFSSIMGEKLHENHILELMKKAGIAEGYLLANQAGFYTLALPASFSSSSSLSAERLDQILQEINPEYSAKRESGRLRQLMIKVMPELEYRELDRKINPNTDHDRFKRKYLVPIKHGD